MSNVKTMPGSSKRIIQITGVFLILLLGYFVQPITYENVDAGNVGLKINLYGTDRGVDNVTLVTGRVWYNGWTTKIVEFPTFTQTVDYSPFTVNTKDNAEFTMDPKLTFGINQALVPQIYRKYRKPLNELSAGVIRNWVFDSYRIAANYYTSDSLMSNRESFENRVQTLLQNKLTKEGFIDAELTHGINPPESLRDMINAKNQSIQLRLKADNDVKKAESEAKVAKAKAEGEATALLVRARAESEANRLRQQSLTPLLIQKQVVEKWDGKLPQYGTVPTFFRNVTQ